AVIRVLLAGPDENYAKLLRQVEAAPYVERSLQEDETVFRLSVPSTTEDLLIPLDEDLESREIYVVDQNSGANLRFRVVLLRGGFFGFLDGRREDGQRWSYRWTLDYSSLPSSREDSPFLGLPSKARLNEVQSRGQRLLSNWLGDSELVRTHADRLRFFPPITQKDLDALEERENVRPPGHLLELWNLTDGLDVGSLECLGSKDARVFDGLRQRGELLVIADLREDGIAGILCDDPEDRHVYLVEPGATGRTDSTVLAPSVKEFIRECIRRARETT
ncbi:MAG: hypothetical protein ACRD2L_07715, partial [Terriglobia bacterium]